MATRSCICVENDDRTWDGIYIHWDGMDVGDTLMKHYPSVWAIRTIILGGFISSLEEDLDKTYTNSRIKEDYESFPSKSEAFDCFSNMDCEYFYFLDREGMLTCQHDGEIEKLNKTPLPMVHS